MTIRPAASKDYSDIVKIYNHAVDERFATADTEYITIESRKNWFAQHSPETYPIYVVFDTDYATTKAMIVATETLGT